MGIAVAGANFKLQGGESVITFDNDATLRASCASSSQASVRHIGPLDFVGGVYDPLWATTATLTNVAASCAGKSLYVPCVAPDSSWPKMFYCVFEGVQDTEPVTAGPYSAVVKTHEDNGAVLGRYVELKCPLPSKEALSELMQDTNHVSLSIHHNSSYDALAELSFEGKPGLGNLLTISLPAPSPPPSPAPPPPPPPPPSPSPLPPLLSPPPPAMAPLDLSFNTCGGSWQDGPTSCSYSQSLQSVTIRTRGIQEWTVPAAGTYRIEARGAQGGGTSQGGKGGAGAILAGTFTLGKGDVLKILVGAKPGLIGVNSAGGGGGTFVYKSSSVFLVAGGGGGATNSGNTAGNAQTTETGGASSDGSAPGGTGGSGGFSGSPRTSGWGGSGAGLTGNGNHELWSSSESTIAYSFTNGGRGGTRWSSNRGESGGFGGGGGCGNYGGGGGGGYSGGGAGKSNGIRGGGGGSKIMGGQLITASVGNNGDGSVRIWN